MAAMTKDGIYVPNVFDPFDFTGSQDSLPDPHELFTQYRRPAVGENRFIMNVSRPVGPRVPVVMQLIYTDGACKDNGSIDAVGGIGVVISESWRISKRLAPEISNDFRIYATSNRAELHAVIFALECKKWYNEGLDALVIATDSHYVADGATLWIPSWNKKGWLKADGAPVANRDLWMTLLALFELYASHGCEIMFWRIPKCWNRVADQAAKEGASIIRLNAYQPF
ncbi:ribonuclease H-like domain-containing protein [Hypomontagnella monticulosa]|nr:ribonuclease H-like domain-containing protein [Hypomontagnella monticulosa]